LGWGVVGGPVDGSGLVRVVCAARLGLGVIGFGSGFWDHAERAGELAGRSKQLAVAGAGAGARLMGPADRSG